MADSPALHTLSVARTARIATLGTPSTTDTWWLVLHGYGELAPEFIQAFEPIAAPHRAVVAPEGLSRFYVDGTTHHNHVGASWMTQEERKYEIEDYIQYIDATVRALRFDERIPSIHVLGFSQGAATASRWALLGDTPIDRLILWGGSPAHDLDLERHAESLRTIDVTLVAGTTDPHLTPERRNATAETLRQHEVPVTIHTFEGGHRLDANTLQTIVAAGS